MIQENLILTNQKENHLITPSYSPPHNSFLFNFTHTHILFLREWYDTIQVIWQPVVFFFHLVDTLEFFYEFLFFHQIVIEHLLSVKRCSRCWG